MFSHGAMKSPMTVIDIGHPWKIERGLSSGGPSPPASDERISTVSMNEAYARTDFKGHPAATIKQ
eukprot:10545553-Alexandrium_andersonii.AAC.1